MRAAWTQSWWAALGMFTVIPVPPTSLERDAAGRAVRWLPAVGLLVAVPAAGVLLAVEVSGGSAQRRLLASTLAVAALAVLTGGLHLDGLTDSADGLASRRPPDEALAIMRRGDAGPLGVAALILVLLLQVTSLATLPTGLPAAAALVLAAVTARVAAVQGTGTAFPAARPEGFGALVAGATPVQVRLVSMTMLLVAVTVTGELTGGIRLAGLGLAGTSAGLIAGVLLCRAARARLGGLTGDVFGAVIEVATTATLLVMAVLS
ncbi:MAG: adenosylcobinamide-GDP ribazoletransferase [Streptosporangiaceae bacterium]